VADFVASGRIIDVIVAMMLIEAIVLHALHRRTGRGIPAPDIAINLVAGASLMLAVRAALTGAAPAWLLLCLGVSLAAHIADVARRWRPGNDPPFGANPLSPRTGRVHK
jgi:hypothetical protein